MCSASTSQHMMCLCSNRGCHQLAACTAADKLVCVQAGSGAHSTQAGSHSNADCTLAFMLCPPLALQMTDTKKRSVTTHTSKLWQTPLSMLSEVTHQSPELFTFVQQRESTKKLSYNHRPACCCKHPSQCSHRQPDMLLEHKRKANTTPFGVNLMRNQVLTYLSISCCQLSWLWLQDLLQQEQDACLVQPQRHWNSVQGDSVPQMGVR